MTKRLRILALGLMIVVLLATLSGCSVDGVKDKIMGIIGPYLPGCQHEGGNATCTEQAVCEKCGETYGSVLGHDIVVDAAKAPTCTETGLTEGKHCTRCDYKVAQETVAALGHTEVVDAAVAATCTKTGLTEGKHCSVCEEVLVAQTETPVIAHTYDEGWDADCNVCGTVRTCAHDGEKTVVAGKGATCTEAGLTDGEKCAICGDVTKNQEEIPALGHDMADATCTAPATCKREGCGHTQGTVKDHAYDEGKITTAPTCTEAGVKTYTCSACGATKTETVAATGHTEAVDAAKDATCTETGLTEGKHCSVCNKVLVKQTEVPVIPHTYDDKYDATCNVCGFERDAECAHTNTVKLEGKDATCDEAGLTAGEKCADCEEILVAQTVIPALGHTEETVAGKDATCTEDGLTEGKKCSVCGETLVAQTVVPALGHTEETVAGKDATCTEDGLTAGKKCSVCGETLVAQEVVPALGHTEETVAGKDATCTEDGLTEGKKCSVCGETLVAQQVVPATGHTEEVVPGIDPDCENTGLTEGKKCSVCGVVLVPREEIDSLGHKWNEGEVTTAPTCTVEGVKTFTCGTCGGTKTETIPVAHDCNDEGVCKVCGEVMPVVPEEGKAYIFGMYQGKVGKMFYIKGGMSGYYMATTEKPEEALHVYIEETNGGYYFYCYVNDVKTYINMVVSGTHVNGAYESTPSTVYTIDEQNCTVIAKVSDTDYWFGTRNDKTYTTVGPCAVSYKGFFCQFYAVHEHDYKEVERVDSTCSENGYVTYECSCGESYDEELELLEHNYVDGICSVCKAPFEHDCVYEEEVTAPTCTEAGYTTYTCTICKASHTGAEVTASGHSGHEEDFKCDVCSMLVKPENGSTLTIAQATALAKAMGNTYTTEMYRITGVIVAKPDGVYGNTTIKDADGNELYVYGLYSEDGQTKYESLSVKPAKGDEITILTVLGCYNNAPQAKSARVVGLVQHTEHVWADATCTSPKTCSICDLTEGDAIDHTYVDGKCTGCGKVEGATAVETTIINFASTDQRTKQDANQQIWANGGVTLINDKDKSTNDVASYSNPVRFYAGSKITIEAVGISKIVITTSESKYTTALVNAAKTVAGATVTQNGNTVTITFATPVDSISFSCAAQIRMRTLTVN